jgi:hypothetical protein
MNINHFNVGDLIKTKWAKNNNIYQIKQIIKNNNNQDNYYYIQNITTNWNIIDKLNQNTINTLYEKIKTI